MNSISANLNVMIKATDKASRVLIRDFGELEKLQASKKSPTNFMTNSIIKVGNLIYEELVNARPNYSILSKKTGLKLNKDKKNIWILDPINGKINFLHGIPHFAITIALQSNNEIISGIIFDPIKNEMFYAEKNNGAFFNNQRIKVSKKNDIEDCLFAIGEKLDIELSIKYRKSGSSALDMAYFASGRYDGYFQQNLKLWDIAAGIILVQEAGGIINDLDLKNYNSLNILSSNSFINEEFKKKINF